MSDNIVVIRTSRDGSENYGDATFHDLGGTGTFLAAAERTRLGIAYQMVVEFEDSSFFKNDITAFSATPG